MKFKRGYIIFFHALLVTFMHMILMYHMLSECGMYSFQKS